MSDLKRNICNVKTGCHHGSRKLVAAPNCHCSRSGMSHFILYTNSLKRGSAKSKCPYSHATIIPFLISRSLYTPKLLEFFPLFHESNSPSDLPLPPSQLKLFYHSKKVHSIASHTHILQDIGCTPVII